MSTLKTHNLQSPDAGSVNIALAPNAGMVVAGLSTYSNQINVGSNIKIGNAGVVTATSFSGDGSNLTGVVSVANQANNRLITATSTTDALYGESTLTYDGTNFLNSSGGKFQIGNDSLPVASSQTFHIKNNNVASQYIRSETSKSDHSYLGFSLKAPNLDFQIWNQGSAGGGYGGTNSVNFYQSGSSLGPYGFYFGTTQALRINTNGNIVMGSSTTSTTRLDIRFTDTTTYSASSNHPNGLKIFNDCATDNGFAGIELAATDGDDYYGSVLLKAIATGVNYSNDLAIQTRHSGTHYERLRIKSDGIIEMGTSIGATSDANIRLRLGRATDCYLGIRATGNNTAETGIKFGDASSEHDGKFAYLHTGQKFRITVGGNDRIFIEANGDLKGQSSNANVIGFMGAKTTAGTTNWNDSTNARSGNGHTLLLGGASNGPGPGLYYHPFTFEYVTRDGTGNMTQIAIPYNGGAIYSRYRYSGTWSGWNSH